MPDRPLSERNIKVFTPIPAKAEEDEKIRI